MLESPYSSDDDEIKNGVSKSTVLEPTIKHRKKQVFSVGQTAIW